METEIRSFADFWPFYLRAHSKRSTRLLHAVGSVLALTCLVLAATRSPWFLLVAPLVGYSFAWYAHFFVQHNRPATFGHPFYSLAAGLRHGVEDGDGHAQRRPPRVRRSGGLNLPASE